MTKDLQKLKIKLKMKTSKLLMKPLNLQKKVIFQKNIKAIILWGHTRM